MQGFILFSFIFASSAIRVALDWARVLHVSLASSSALDRGAMSGAGSVPNSV